MSYKVLSLKWRPQTFDDIVGQDHVTKTLINAFKLDRVAQGYMFTGPRGVGKTTTARILSRALNAEGGAKYDFDPSSNLSLEIAEGRALDVLEIDGASNRGIEEIRNLREQIKFAPMVGNYKVIIIDEVHMLTNPAFNALLRTLEEPPSHGKFIFCTTDIHKVPATIISRCQRFDFNRISTDTIISRINFILDKESVSYDLDSLQIIARKADGSMRDALSILDQVISFCGSEINHDKTVIALGVIPTDLYFDYTNALLSKNGGELLSSLSKFLSFGVPAEEVVNGISNHIKSLLYAQIDKGKDLLDMNQENKKKYILHSSNWDNRDLLRCTQVLMDVSSHIRRSDDPYLLLEFTSLKLLEMDKSVSLESLLVLPSNEVDDDSLSNNINEQEIAKVQELVIKNNDTNLPGNVKVDEKSNDKNKRDDIIEVEIEVSSDKKEQVEKIDIIDQKVLSDSIAEENSETKIENIEPKENYFDNESNPVTKTSKKIDLKAINEKWKIFIDSVHIKKPSIASILDKSKPVEVSGSDVVFEINSTLDFHVSMIEKNRDIINEILSEEYGIGTGFKVLKGSKKNIKSPVDQVLTNATDSEQDEKVRDKVVDLFDGEILT
ncbi:DNA polymerase III subunit gamma/tau [Candidatus Marinimicrobia bacterium]|nr:DNA polymerase III subunit gamma/tau [Candidatus Neomarinimicrobiota bacterium]